MSKAKKKNGMSREEATNLYRELQKRVNGDPSVREKLKGAVGARQSGGPSWVERFVRNSNFKINGNSAAIALVIIFACAKLGIAALEHSGFVEIEQAEATLVSSANGFQIAKPVNFTPGQFSKEEMKVLTMLDARRTELEARDADISRRTAEIKSKEQALMVQMNELRILTEKLKSNREQDDRKRSNQIEQLSKVYSSMNPEEASRLMEQLDVTIALSLLQKMPEKRIGQILSLMSPERALMITKMLSAG